jgi:hypothetical protein
VCVCIRAYTCENPVLDGTKVYIDEVLGAGSLDIAFVKIDTDSV